MFWRNMLPPSLGPKNKPSICFHGDFLLGSFFDPEDGDDMLLRNVGSLSTDYTALYPRR
jgi:hypothetical protein